MAAFALPDIYDFPPFFTLQLVDASRTKQLEQWKQIIVGWHGANKQTTMTVKDWKLWSNEKIARRLGDDGIAAVMDFVVATGAGEWADASRATCKIFSKSPAEWAVQLHKWATENGLSVPGSLYTVFELHSGDISYGSAFAGMDPFILMKALEHLEKNGLVELMRGENIDETGVKFKER